MKQVCFEENPRVRVMRVWEYASRSARRGGWEQAARDRVRFQMRIERTKKILDPVLEKKRSEFTVHREEKVNE